MKKFLLCAMLAVTVVCGSSGQDFRRKLGNPSNHEMKMTVFEPDTSAAAVVLYQNVRIFYELDFMGISENWCQLSHEYEMRIKVLKPEGTDVANITIPYYERGKAREQVRIISATAFNYEDGKTVKTQLKREHIFDEQVSQNRRLKKFSIPNVKAGTVIEYKYTITSNIAQRIRDIEIQGDYPVVYSHGNVVMPEMFRHKIYTTGYNNIKSERKSNTVTIQLREGSVTEPATAFSYEAQDIPALKDEPNVWASDDFRTRISVEISAFVPPGGIPQSFSTTWKDIDKTLDEGSFGRALKISCPYSDEIKAMKATTDGEIELVREVLKFVTSKIRWDKRYTIYSENPRAAARNGSGNSAEVNFVLASALREAGFAPVPVLLNPRHFGRIPISTATLDKINTFILLVPLQDGSHAFVDATNRNNDINVLPTELMVDRAHIYGSGNSEMINLTNLAHNTCSTIISGELTPEGKIIGNVQKHYMNTEAVRFKERYRSKADEDEFIETLENNRGIEVTSFEVSDLNQKDVSEKYDFEMECPRAGNMLYLNATIIPTLTVSPLKQQERKLPLELPYPSIDNIVGKITIPEGYVIEEAPKSEILKLYDSGAAYTYVTQISGNTIEFRLTIELNRIIYPVEEYPEIFELFGRLVSKATSNFVIKKL